MDAAHETAAAEGRTPPLVIAVTVLTSMNQAMLAETGVDRAVQDQVVRLAELAQQAGLDGVVASPQETRDAAPALRPGLHDRHPRDPRRRGRDRRQGRPAADDEPGEKH